MKTNIPAMNIGNKDSYITFDPHPEDQMIDDYCILKNKNKREVLTRWFHDNTCKNRAYAFIHDLGLWDDFNSYVEYVRERTKGNPQ